jgi:plastocyanin
VRAVIAGVVMAVASLAPVAGATELNAVVRDQSGAPVPDAVVIAVPRSGSPPRPARVQREAVDQIDKEFVPYVKAVAVGSPVFFPNKDNIRHHVYSFSPVKTFELPLYTGTPAHPVIFDRPGIVTIGCNIHDWMIGFIYVAESPWFATTGPEGRARLEALPAGAYAVRAWHPRIEASESTTTKPVTIGTAPLEAAWQLTLRPEGRPRRAPVPGQRGYR